MNPHQVLARAVVGAAVLGLASVASATPYASEITTSGSTVNFYLNQNASTVTVSFDGGSSSQSIDPTKGAHAFDMTGHTSYSIAVAGSQAADWVMVPTTPADTTFSFPAGVALNKNPASPHFGKAYVSNSNLNGAGMSGIYVLNADASANTFNTGGVNWMIGQSAGPSPFHSTVGPDDTLYVTDFWQDRAFAIDPTFATPGVQVVDSTNNAFIAGIQVTGTQAAGNRKLYVVNGDTGDTTRRGIISYALGSAASAPPGDPGTQEVGPSFFAAGAPNDVSIDSAGNIYTVRYHAGTAAAIAKFNGGTQVWQGALGAIGSYGIDVDEPRGLLAVADFDTGNVRLYKTSDGTAAGSFSAGTHLRDVAFDAAGNLYAVDSGTGALTVWSRGGDWLATTGSDGSFTIGSPVVVFAGDVNGDHIVNQTDLSTIVLNWQKTGQTRDAGDLSGDGIVNQTDLSEVVLNWQKTYPASAPTLAEALAMVPEPTSLTLLLAPATLALRRRRR